MRINVFTVLGLVAALVVTDAVAQQAPPGQRPASGLMWTAPEGALLSSAVIGARVKNREGKDLGKIEQLVIDPKTGQVSHAIAGLGGLAGVGETRVVLAWRELQLMPDPSLPNRTVASVDQAVVDRAPQWGRDERRPYIPSASPPTTPSVPDRPAPSGRGRY